MPNQRSSSTGSRTSSSKSMSSSSGNGRAGAKGSTARGGNLTASRNKGDVHVTPHEEGGWKVEVVGAGRAMAVTKTQREAIEIGRERARKEKSEFVIHGRDGRIREKDSYGNDPNPPRDGKN